MKTFKDVLFSFNVRIASWTDFLPWLTYGAFTQDDEADTKGKAKTNGTHDDVKPSKTKTGAAPELKGVKAGSKVLRAKTRQQHIDPDTATSTLARITAHQKDLHGQRQEEGIARFAGEDSKDGREDGKGWKKFQSYKGELALPKEAETLKVGKVRALWLALLTNAPADLRGQEELVYHTASTRIRGPIPHQHYKKRQQI